VDGLAFKRLEDAFIRGQKGQVPSFDFWLKEQGFDPETINQKKIFNFLAGQQPINQQQAFDDIGEFLGYFSSAKEGKFHVVVTGVDKSGKTFLTSILSRFLSEKTRLRSKTLNAKDFCEVNEDEQVFHKILDEVEAEKYDVLLIDDCHLDKNIQYSLRQFTMKLADLLLITTWEPVFWDYFSAEIEMVAAPSKIMMLRPFSEQNTTELLNHIVGFTSNSKVKLNEETLQEIHRLSQGIPGLSILLFVESLRKAFDEGQSSIDKDVVLKVAMAWGIAGVEEKLRCFSDIHMLILRQSLLSRDERGIRPTNLVQLLNRDKATISYYLKQLCQQQVLEYVKVGIFVFYRVPETLKPFVEQRLSNVEGDFLA
jgi:hypothetical protein